MKRTMLLGFLLLAGALVGCQAGAVGESSTDTQYAPDDPSLKVATFAGGCFWCVESGFEKIPGVVEAVSGYTGGHTENPTYEEVSSGSTGHTESVQVYYDPAKITYEGLLQGFWRFMNPTDANGQFVDRGNQYRPAIFYHNAEQKRIAEASKKALDESGRYDKPVVIEIVPFKVFYPAEKYHQDYYKKNPIRYKIYTFNSGRYQFIDKVWGDDQHIDFSKYAPEQSGADEGMKHSDAAQAQGLSGLATPVTGFGFDPKTFTRPSDAELKKKLTPIQYEVTREDGTERAFHNPYWDEKRAGLYVDIISGEPLYLSTDKFKSGTGWPSFTRPINPDAVVEKEDRGWFGTRTEIRSRYADSHLGHVFNDGPAPTGLRYCMDSAAMLFIPKDQMAAAGYGQYVDRAEPVRP